MPETDAVKSFGHHKWGGDIRDVNVSLSINRNSGVDVAGVLSTTIRIYPSIPFSLVEQGENVQKKLSASFDGRSFAGQQDSNKQADLFEMSLEDLMDVPVVMATSRQVQKFGEPSAPVSIITAEDIHYSGLTTIPEILQFAPGVDVLKISRHRYAVGIHGLHETISDRAVLLVNGRSADNTAYGGPDFQGLPVSIEDVERIEVVRSPGSASWGANSLTGVINIITKKPKDIPCIMAKTTISEFGDSYTHLRWADTKQKWAWRSSISYEDGKSSQDVLDDGAPYKSFTGSTIMDGLMGFNGYKARDFFRNQRFDSEIFYDVSDATKLSFGLGQTHIDSGDLEFGAYYPMKNIREEHIRSFVRIEHKFDNGYKGYMQWHGKYWNANWPQITIFSTLQNEIEGQLDLALSETYQRSIGASFGWDYIDVDRQAPQQIWVSGEPLDEYSTGVFLIDRWRATNKLILEGQIRGDWYSGTQTDWSGRLSALYGLDDKRNHVVRLSIAKAFRTPLSVIRKTNMRRVPMGLDMYLINVTESDDLDNEETFSLEAGYTAKLMQKLTFRTDAYYQRFRKMIGYQVTTNFLNQNFAVAKNFEGADAWGVETELALKGKAGKLSAWYTFNGFQSDRDDQDLRAFLPAKNKVGLTGRLFMCEGWILNANYVFKSTTAGNPVTRNDVDKSNRLDLTISKNLVNNKGQILAGISDLLTKTHEPIRESVQFSGHEVPGRTFFLSLMLWF
jgi:outer membrane cobalamin receptor